MFLNSSVKNAMDRTFRVGAVLTVACLSACGSTDPHMAETIAGMQLTSGPIADANVFAPHMDEIRKLGDPSDWKGIFINVPRAGDEYLIQISYSKSANNCSASVSRSLHGGGQVSTYKPSPADCTAAVALLRDNANGLAENAKPCIDAPILALEIREKDKVSHASNSGICSDGFDRMVSEMNKLLPRLSSART